MRISAVVGTLMATVVAAATIATPADAQSRRAATPAEPSVGTHPKSGYYRSGGTRVKGFVQRRGGYSYSYADTINTYGDSRTRYGGTNVFRDPMLDRQSTSGPFDHGFFFDSGMGRIGGDAPYLR
jgi:hypothetical protein